MDDQLLTLGELCSILKMKPAGVYGLVFRRKIPTVKLSRRCLRFRKSEIDAWIAGKAQTVNQVIEPVKTKSRRGRPRKSAVAENYVNNLVEASRKEVLNNEKIA